MDIKLSVTLIGCEGDVDFKTLEKNLRSVLTQCDEQTTFGYSGIKDYPDSVRVKVVGVEHNEEDE